MTILATFIRGIIGLSKIEPSKEDQRIYFDIFSYIFPFASFGLDQSTKKLQMLGEKGIFICTKLLLLIYFLGVYVLALQQDSKLEYYALAYTNFILYPLYSIAYAYLLRKGKLK